ncbi:MAG: hypothetical protein IPN89_06630 [Saprospiraceae bacterium]|nr:hypothetical protein [Saprospiraceae bacterium]
MKGNLLDAKQYDAIFISPEKYHITTIAHEVGHYLGLFHTFGTRNYSAGNRSVTDEKVDGSNCLQAGDFICDTRADPGNNINSSCTYICSTSSSNNCNKEPGTNQPYTPDTKNLMSYFHECRSLFSPQQISIMNAYASSNRNFQIPTSGCERDSNEPSYGYPSYEYSVGLGDNWVSFPPLVFTKTVTGKYDNLWDSDLYFMNLQGGNRSYKISVISDIPAILKIFRAGVAFSNSEHLILPGVTNVIYNNIPGEGHRKSFEIRPTITPGCGSTYTITIENYNENCNDENEPNNTKQSSTSLGELINIGQSLNTSGLIETSYDVDFYSFNMKAKGKYEMTLESDAVDFDFSYIDENNIEFKSHIKNGVGTELWVVENKKNTPITGYIKVQTKGTLSSCLSRYNLKVQVIEKPVDIVCNPDVYEPNNLFGSIEGPTFIGNDQSSSKVFHANIHDPYDIDIYKVLLNKRGTISITLTDMPIQYSMFAGHRIGVPDDEDYYIPIVEASISNTPTVAKIVYEKLDNNPYTFYFDIYNLLNNFDVRCTDYKVTIEWTPKNESAECFDVTYEPNSSPSTSSIIFGTLDNESKQIEINPKIGSVGDYDYFKVKLVKNGNLKLNVFSDNYPVRIELSKDGYNFCKSKNSTGSNDPNINPLTYDFLTGSDETLYLRAYSPGNQFNCNHTYSLLLDWAPVNTVDGSSAGSCIDALAEPNDTFSNANDGFFKFNEISQSQNGEFFISSPSDLDFFKIITKYKGLMDVVLSNLPVDLDFEVFDENSNLIGTSKNSFISSEKLTFVSNASVYYIKVVGKNKQFDCINKYTLNVNWQRELDCNDFLNNDISSAIQLAKLSHIPKDTVISNHKISRFGEKDYFRLTNKSTGTLHVVLSEGALDYDIYLIDKNENILAKSARYTGSDEFYYFQSNPDEELYIYIEAKGFKFDCSENYIFSLDWTPQVENPVQNEYPCNSVISPDVAFDLDGNPYGRVWSGNLSSGQSNISNYYCGSGSYGKELVFEFYYDPKPGQELDITLWKMKNPGLDFYLLDGCDPTISFCYGKVESEYWSFLGYYRASSRFRDLETNKKYYIFVDGVLENEEFEIEISIRDPWVIWEDPDTGCGIPRPLFNYQCVGGKYNVIMDLTGVNVKSLTSPTHIVTKLSNSVYKINNVSSEDVYFKVNYVSSKGFSCVADFVIPKYICNINVDNCFGLNPPVVPSKMKSALKMTCLQ